MATRLVTFSMAVLMAAGCFAQARFEGSVLGEGDVPLAGASIIVGEDQAFGGSTDATGWFNIGGVRTGTHRVRVSYVGYLPIDTLMVIDEVSGGRTFRMQPDAIMMRAAEVTALRAGDRGPFARSLMTREAIERVNMGVDLPYILDLQPSVVATSDGGTGIGYTYMRVRGTDATRTNITVNGVPFNDPESQGAFLVNMPDLATSAEDIELQRGVGSSTNGPAAFGASVNVRTTSVKRDPWESLSASGGSYNTQRYSVSAGTGLIDERFSLDLRLSSITSDGYIDRASADLKSYFLQGAWMGKSRSLRFITFRGKEITYQAWGGVPRDTLPDNRTYNSYTYDNEVDNYDQTHYHLLFDQKLGTNATLNVTLFRVLGAGYFEQFREEDDLSTYGIAPEVINGDTTTTSDVIRRRWLDNTLTGANVSADIKLGVHRLVLGGSYSEYEGAHFGEIIWARWAGGTEIRDRYYDDDAVKTDANAFAKLTYKLGEVTELFGDAQVRAVEHRLTGLDGAPGDAIGEASYFFFNPKAGISVRLLDGGRAYASVAVGNKEPNRDDLINGRHPQSEQLLDYELGYEQRSARLSTGVNLYYMDYTDQLVLTGELNDVGAALRTNVQSSYRAGIELTLAAQVTEQLLWRANATLSRNKILDHTEFVDDWDNGGQVETTYAESDLSFSPGLIASSELSFRFWDKGEVGHADLTLVTKYVGEQYLDNTSSTDRMLDAYLVNDARLNLALLRLKGTKSVDFNLTVRNIFSELYESNGWVYSYVYNGERTQDVGLYPQAPLNVLGGVTIRF